MITRQETMAARTKSFLGRSAPFRTGLLAPASPVMLNDSAVCEYSPAPAATAPVPDPVPVAPAHSLIWTPDVWVWEER